MEIAALGGGWTPSSADAPADRALALLGLRRKEVGESFRDLIGRILAEAPKGRQMTHLRSRLRAEGYVA